jgi:hypothetical protein
MLCCCVCACLCFFVHSSSIYTTTVPLLDGNLSLFQAERYITHCDSKVLFTFLHLLRPQEVYQKYERMLYRSFIELQPDVKWCPNPKGCDRAVK